MKLKIWNVSVRVWKMNRLMVGHGLKESYFEEGDYLSIILLFISLFLNIISIHLFGGLNENQLAGGLTAITLLLGAVFYFYYLIRISLKLKKINDKKSILNHFNIIWVLFGIFIFVSVNV